MTSEEQPGSVSERMRSDWNERAREDAHYYVAFGGRDQDEDNFLATAADVLPCLEAELKRFPKDANRRAWRALEIGCGPGRLMLPLSRHFGEIHGVDVSDEMIRLARERLREIPHAHVHATNGASLSQFADESFDFVYSYAVFQHIPSRDVVLEYMREARRVLKPRGIFRGQFNGLPHASVPDTWSGVVFSAAEIRAFTREQGFQLLELVGVDTQYMWTTWRKGFFPLPTTHHPPPSIRRITNAHSSELAIPDRGRHAALSIWAENLPAECDLNNLEIVIEGVSAAAFYIGPPNGTQQVNAWLPRGIRTGLLPVELRLDGKLLCPPTILRVMPAGPLTPRITCITDGINLVQKNRSTTGALKIHLEEISAPESVSAMVGGLPAEKLEITCIDPVPPRYEVNLQLPKGLSAGPQTLEIRVSTRRLLPVVIDVQGNSL